MECQDFDVTPLDHRIAQNGGTTSRLERLPYRLRKFKSENDVELERRIEELTRENGRLREELAFHEGAHRALRSLFVQTKDAYELLRGALQGASERLVNSEGTLLSFWGIRLDDTERGDISII